METEDKFLQGAKHALDDAEKNLDAGALARLRVARRDAIEQGLRRATRHSWLLPVGGFATAGIALAVAGALWFAAPNGNPMQAGMGDLELLAAHENPDFFAELEFYEWLERNENAG